MPNLSDKKKILILGGNHSQIRFIQYAKESGFKVITVGYSPMDAGHKYSDEYHNISTVDKHQILNLAKKLNVDAVSAFASDPAAVSAAYVSEKLGLKGGSYEAVLMLSKKSLFRNFLKANDFNTPWFLKSDELSDLIIQYDGNSKAIIKPDDSSGSKGVFLIENKSELKNKFDTSKLFSKTGDVILEQYIKRKGPQIHGEAFVLDGDVVFMLLGDQYFDQNSGLIPYSTIVPSIEHSDIIDSVHELVKSLVFKSNFKTGGLNIEVIRDMNDNLFVIELGARNGGNFMPEMMKLATGYDLFKTNLDSLISNNVSKTPQIQTKLKAKYAQLILHSKYDGVFMSINISEKLKKMVVFKMIHYKIGDRINEYKNSKDVLGVVIFKLETESLLNEYLYFLKINEWIKVDQIKLR